jgi:hypothetical protein
VGFDALTVHEDVIAVDLDEDGSVPALPHIAQHTFAGQRKRDLATIHVAAQQDFRHEGCVQLASTERWANWNLARSERWPWASAQNQAHTRRIQRGTRSAVGW